jgi:exosortase/archaeosortase family protein
MTRVTFEAVYRLLDGLVPTLEIDPANRVIDSGRFAVSIDPVCSGLEGMGLMLAFGTVLLLLFRHEYIFPRALLLIPAGLLLSFALNIARIAGLVLIGNAGHPEAAVYGFHSQAGWITFNAAAVGIAVVSMRSRWFSRAAAERNTAVTGENPTAVYLLQYLAVILGVMLSRAVFGGFEGAYGQRLLLAGLLPAETSRRGLALQLARRAGRSRHLPGVDHSCALHPASTGDPQPRRRSPRFPATYGQLDIFWSAGEPPCPEPWQAHEKAYAQPQIHGRQQHVVAPVVEV